MVNTTKKIILSASKLDIAEKHEDSFERLHWLIGDILSFIEDDIERAPPITSNEIEPSRQEALQVLEEMRRILYKNGITRTKAGIDTIEGNEIISLFTGILHTLPVKL